MFFLSGFVILISRTPHQLISIDMKSFVKRFDTLSYASQTHTQMRIKAFCGVSVYIVHAGISARQRPRESVARRKMLQSSTVLIFHALRQRTQPFSQSFTGVMNIVCSGSILQLRRRARTGQSACGAGIVKRTWSRSKCSRDPAG